MKMSHDLILFVCWWSEWEWRRICWAVEVDVLPLVITFVPDPRFLALLTVRCPLPGKEWDRFLSFSNRANAHVLLFSVGKSIYKIRCHTLLVFHSLHYLLTCYKIIVSIRLQTKRRNFNTSNHNSYRSM